MIGVSKKAQKKQKAEQGAPGDEEAAEPEETQAELPEDETQEQTGSREQELIEQLQRLQAEFENYKRRTEREQEAFRATACADVIESLLPVLDNFELALSNAEANDNFHKGVEMIYAQLKEALVAQGLAEIPAEGMFNPRLHEAMLTEESEQEKNTIIEVLQKGYTLGEKVLRSAKVKVAR